MNELSGKGTKVRAEHVKRSAFVYVRQSSPGQMRHHLESERRQYGFAERRAALGWSRERVVIMDEDQGKSGATPDARVGFAKLVGAVVRGEVGIAVSIAFDLFSGWKVSKRAPVAGARTSVVCSRPGLARRASRRR